MSAEHFQQLDALVTMAQHEQVQFDKKPTKAVARRVRAHLLEVKKLCDLMRKEVTVLGNAIPVVPRKKGPQSSLRSNIDEVDPVQEAHEEAKVQFQEDIEDISAVKRTLRKQRAKKAPLAEK